VLSKNHSFIAYLKEKKGNKDKSLKDVTKGVEKSYFNNYDY